MVSLQTAFLFSLVLICATEAGLLDGMVRKKPRNVASAQSKLRDSVEDQNQDIVDQSQEVEKNIPSFEFVLYPSIAYELSSGASSSKMPFSKEDGSCLPRVRNDTCYCAHMCEHSRATIAVHPEMRRCAQNQQQPVLGIGSCNFQRAGPSRPALEERFIDVIMKTVLGLVHESWNGYIDGRVWPPESAKAMSMIGLRRMNNLQFLLEEVIRLNITGDFIETGAWRGGATIVAAAVFLAYSQTCPSESCRRVFVADSFRGIPPVNVKAFPADAAHAGADRIPILLDNSAQRVRDSFAALGLLTDAVVFLEGWFKDTLPAARRSTFGRFAVIRLDGDTYEATWQALDNLYDLLSPGVFVLVDDYTDWIGCRSAVTDFRERHGVTAPVHPVYHGSGEEIRGVWWQKS
jgi:O-methyltransferase